VLAIAWMCLPVLSIVMSLSSRGIADGWSPSRPRLAGRILGEEPMSKFVRAFSLRIDGFLVVVGGFLIFASMKAKVAKTESLPPPLPRRVALSHLT
jgi:hypothetical protein